MNIQEYININYSGNKNWFEEECKKPEHTYRISKVLNNKKYLQRIHKILAKKDVIWKGETFKTRKTIYNMLKNVANYHTTYTVSKPVSIVASENNLKIFSDIYTNGGYEKTDYIILNKVLKFGDIGEYVYIDNGDNGKKVIKSHLIASEDFYPIYSSNNEYICCIEHWTDSVNNISYYTVYYPNTVERWSNEGGNLEIIEQTLNISGLPLHHHNLCDGDDCFGESFLEDLIPLADEFEDFINRLADAIHTLSTNPISVVIGGQGMSEAAPAEGIGYSIEVAGDFKYAVANMDYQSIKYYLDNHLNKFVEACKMPSIGHGQTNISNISETTIQIIYEDTDKFSKENQIWFKESIIKRLNIIRDILKKQNINVDDSSISVSFNVDRPINMSQIIDDILKCVPKGTQLMSVQSAMEKLPLISDVNLEIERIKKEGKNKVNIDNDENVNANDLQ